MRVARIVHFLYFVTVPYAILSFYLTKIFCQTAYPAGLLWHEIIAHNHKFISKAQE